jgi:hypothetical protein
MAAKLGVDDPHRMEVALAEQVESLLGRIVDRLDATL